MLGMNTKLQLKLDIIAKVDKGEISIINASKLLKKSRRTIERYLKDYRDKGITFTFHKNKNRIPVNKISVELKKDVQNLIRNEYFDFNHTHLKEKLEEDKGIFVKRETLRKWAYEIHHVKRAKRRRTPKVRKRRDRMESCGLMIQLDGSTHRWFGNEKSCLILAIDDANSEVHAEFFKSETTEGCMKVLKELVSKKGIFKLLYVDKAGIFAGAKRCHFSQVQRACKELGIEIIFANSPQGKGRVERSFGTLQDRLIPELRRNRITTQSEANKYLKEKFITNFWEKNIMVEPENLKSEYNLVPEGINSNDIFITKKYQKVRPDHTFSYGNKLYRIENITHSMARYQVEILVEQNGNFKVLYARKEIKVSEINNPRKISSVNREFKKRIDAIQLAENLNSNPEVSRKTGISICTIGRYKKILKEKGKEGLREACEKESHGRTRTPKDIEAKVVTLSLKNPHLGREDISRQLRLQNSIDLHPSTIYHIWQRHHMQTITLRTQRAKKQKVA